MEPTVDDGLDAAVRTFRTAAWTWMLVVTALSFASVRRPAGAVTGVAAAGLVTLAWDRARPRTRRLAGRLLLVEVVVGASVIAVDGWVLEDGRVQSFGSVWPLAGVLAVAVHIDGRLAAGAGVVLGMARALGELVFVGGAWSASRALGITSTGVVFALAGWAAGWASTRIRAAEGIAARARAREEVAAELHDGVLQTLAVIQRRASDDELVRLARGQEAELRRFLAGPLDAADDEQDSAVILRTVAADATGRFDLRIEVAAVPPLPGVAPLVAEALRGIVSEALANVAKHAGVDRAVVFAEAVDDQLVVSVTDDGVGFEPGDVVIRGLDGSVRRRAAAVAGSAVIESHPGHGTTVTVQLPVGRA